MDQFLYAAAAQAQANAVAAQYYANASAAHAINQGRNPIYKYDIILNLIYCRWCP